MYQAGFSMTFSEPLSKIRGRWSHITYVPKDDWGYYSVMITHSNVALKLRVLVADLFCASPKFRLAQSGDGLVTDVSISDANLRRDGCAQKVLHGVVAQLR